MRALRDHAARSGLGRPAAFRWRGTEVSRIEGFSDAALAFAVTLLVVSLEVPASLEELMWAVESFPVFGITFAFIVGIWFFHFQFFRRYGMEDGATVVLNAMLLFVVLFYVYPLKFLFTFLGWIFFGLGGPAARALAEDPGLSGRVMMTVYGAGFMAVFGIFFLLYLHAWRRREELELDAYERYETASSLQHLPIYVGVGLLSIAIVQLSDAPGAAFWSGISYSLIGPFSAAHAIWRQRRWSRIVAATDPAAAGVLPGGNGADESATGSKGA